MVHYRHSYHAGNFADVFKHVLLVGLLAALNRKDKGWCYLDTHAGAGDYDLAGEGAERTGEWREGIGRLGGAQEAPELVAGYLRLVEAARSRGRPQDYPGSPQLARALARPQDRLVLCEQVPEVAAALKQSMHGDARVSVHLRDGYEAHALLPPPERRGLMLIDPPFERGDELDAVAGLIGRSAARFSGGVYAAWYPVKNRHQIAQFARRVARDTGRPVLQLEFDAGGEGGTVRIEAPGRPTIEKTPMHACGLLVVNPPYGFEQAADAALHWLVPRLAQGPGAGFTITTP